MQVPSFPHRETKVGSFASRLWVGEQTSQLIKPAAALSQSPHFLVEFCADLGLANSRALLP
eukprot:2668439-Rhodomonas_salina.1